MVVVFLVVFFHVEPEFFISLASQTDGVLGAYLANASLQLAKSMGLAFLGAVSAAVVALKSREIYRVFLSSEYTTLPYGLFLRNFRNEHSQVALNHGDSRKLERVIVHIFSKDGPIVAVDNTDLPGFSGGIVRVRVSNDAWRSVVDSFSRDAKFIIVDFSVTSVGLIEELELIFQKAGDVMPVTFILMTGRSVSRERNWDKLKSIAGKSGIIIPNTSESPGGVWLRNGRAEIFGVVLDSNDELDVEALVRNAYDRFSGDYEERLDAARARYALRTSADRRRTRRFRRSRR